MNPSQEKIIRGQLHRLAAQVSFTADETDLTRLGKVGGITKFFTKEVEVKLEPVKIRDGRGILSVAGALADDPEWDQIMEEIYLERKGIYRQASQEK